LNIHASSAHQLIRPEFAHCYVFFLGFLSTKIESQPDLDSGSGWINHGTGEQASTRAPEHPQADTM
jgi:hypothetical protein